MNPAVEIAQGALVGAYDDGALRFSGIPYARPPLGPLRWRPPEPPESWTGVRDATAFGPLCPQLHSPMERLWGASPGDESEDCLSLNVWTPACDGKQRAVMVEIHGGGFTSAGSSHEVLSGRYLAAKGDVVVVSMNYRLGAFGFLNLADATDGRLPGTGVEGLLDQIAALEWVRDNIAAFGGDPRNVTIFGESAGAFSVGALLASPRAQGLFHRAIAQSGSAHIGSSRQRSAAVARLFLDKAGVPIAEAERLRDLSVKEILAAQKALLAQGLPLPFRPTIDGDVLPELPLDLIRAGSAPGVPVLAGFTRDETKLFTASDANLRAMDLATLQTMATGLVGEEHVASIMDGYADGSPFERWNAMATDQAFGAPASRLLAAQASHGPAHAYRFDWTSPMMDGAFGACHALDLAFVHGTHDEELRRPFYGAGQRADALADAMIQSWTAFARTGNPGWPQYDPDLRRTMIFSDADPRIEAVPDNTRHAAWAGVPDGKLGFYDSAD